MKNKFSPEIKSFRNLASGKKEVIFNNGGRKGAFKKIKKSGGKKHEQESRNVSIKELEDYLKSNPDIPEDRTNLMDLLNIKWLKENIENYKEMPERYIRAINGFYNIFHKDK